MNTDIKKIFNELALQAALKAEACGERILCCGLNTREDKTRVHIFLIGNGARTLKEVFYIPDSLCAAIVDLITERDMTALQILWFYRLASKYNYSVYVTIDRHQEIASEN